MALHIPHSILHLARLLYVRPENLDPTTYVYLYVSMYVCMYVCIYVYMYIQKVTISCLNRATVNNISSPVNPPEAAHTHTTEAVYTHTLSPLEAAHSHHTLSPPETAHTHTQKQHTLTPHTQSSIAAHSLLASAYKPQKCRNTTCEPVERCILKAYKFGVFPSRQPQILHTFINSTKITQELISALTVPQTLHRPHN